MDTTTPSGVDESRDPLPRRGYRPNPTPRDVVHLAIAGASNAFAAGHERYQAHFAQGTLHLCEVNPELWRLALVNRAGERTVVGQAFRSAVGFGLTRAIAEVLRHTPTDAEAKVVWSWSALTIANLMRMRRDNRTLHPRSDGTVYRTVPGAAIVIGANELHATTGSGGIRLVFEGRWDSMDAARVADAMLRDLAPEARHITYTSSPRGYYRNESGSRMYDGSSWAHCSCGWYDAASDRASARASAAWHREHPALYHPEASGSTSVRAADRPSEAPNIDRNGRHLA